MKIAIIGPYPPPYGGISIHVQRMEALLLNHGHTPSVFSKGGAIKWMFLYCRRRATFDVIHFHDISWKNRVFIGLIGSLGFKVILTIHGDSLKNQLDEENWIKRRLLGLAMRHITHIVCVKNDIRDILLPLGVKFSNVSVINAYLPPILDHEVSISQILTNFMESHTPLIVANGFEVIPLSNDTDLYGIEMTIDLCARLVGDYPKLGCLFFLSQIGNQDRYNDLTAKTSRLRLNDRFHFIIGESLTPALKRAMLFVRPTFQDGYGVSVTEALYLGVVPLASDVCKREKGAIVFKCGDLDDFYRCARQVLDNYETAKQTMLGIKPMSAYEPLMKIYQSVAMKRF